MISADVIVIGAGLAGTCAAESLGRLGFSVILIDPHASCPPLFRAEKLEPDQVQILRKLGLLNDLLPLARRIREIGCAYNGRLFQTLQTEQYGISYLDMVNALRANARAAQQKVGRVENIETSPEFQRVKLAGGEELTSRLIVLACGVSSDLKAKLGFQKEVIQKEQSLTFGFSIVRADQSPFPFDALTYHPTNYEERVDYLSLFSMGHAMRANLFTFRRASDPRVRALIMHPEEELRRIFPKLAQLIGEFQVVTKVETGRVDLYRMRGQVRSGVVLIGDAFQNACPSTGTGVSKVLTDVDVLSKHVPQCLATPGMAQAKIAAFYEAPQKRSSDLDSLTKARYRRLAVTASSLSWRIHRLRLRLGMQFGGPGRWNLVTSFSHWRTRNVAESKTRTRTFSNTCL